MAKDVWLFLCKEDATERDLSRGFFCDGGEMCSMAHHSEPTPAYVGVRQIKKAV